MTEMPDLSGLPEGPWILEDFRKTEFASFRIEATSGEVIAIAVDERCARAIAAIPAMVEEIGRLKGLLAYGTDTDAYRALRRANDVLKSDCAECFADNDRLHSLNAEMRTEMESLIERFKACMILSGTDEEWTESAVEKARAILAKSEPANAVV